MLFKKVWAQFFRRNACLSDNERKAIGVYPALEIFPAVQGRSIDLEPTGELGLSKLWLLRQAIGC